MTDDTPGMLAGLRVLDLTTGGALLCGRILGDLGADVIAVEPPGGNPARQCAPFWHDQPGAETSLFWLAYSANKRSVTLDLAQDQGQTMFRQLAAGADVILESFPPGYLDELGLDYASLAAENSRLILTSITPFGQSGPRRHYRATDLVTMALGGSAFLVGAPERAPLRIGFPQAMLHAGAEAAVATLLALQYRHRAGIGQQIDVAAQACVVWTLMNATHYAALGQPIRHRFGPGRESLPGKRRMIYPCKDGYVVVIFFGGAIGGPRCKKIVQWIAERGKAPTHFFETDWDTWDDVYLADLGDGTQAEVARVEDVVAEFVRPFTMRELYDEALARGIMIAPVAQAQTIGEDPQLAAREFFVPVHHAALDADVLLPGAFALSSVASPRIRQGAPQLGEHNAEVLGRELGISGDIIAQHADAAANASPRAWPRPPLPRDDTPPAPHAPLLLHKRPLRNVRILDLSWYGVGPLGTKYLADHGADVIKIESALRPDGLRQAPPWQGSYENLDSSQFFANYNTNKRSIALNLSTPAARRLVRKLVREWADVVVESFRPGTMAKWELDYDILRQLRPDLIMLSTSMQGQTGPHAHYAGFGNMLAALCGLYDLTGYPDSGPMPIYGAYTDFVVCRFVGSALLAALEHRRRTGEGQYIDVSQYEASLHMLAPTLLDYAVNDRITPRRGNDSAAYAPHGIYRCAGDDCWCAIAVTNEEEWQAFCGVIGHPAWTREAQFSTLEGRLQHKDTLNRSVESWTQTLPSHTVMELLQHAGVPAGVVQNATEVFHDPQLRYRNFFVPLDHPRMGRVEYEGSAFHLSESPGALAAPAPLLGQQTDEVLGSVLQLPPAEIAALRTRGVLH